MMSNVDYKSPIKNLSIYNFRNIRNLSFSPGERLNIIYGDNAKGKTNLIEAIWMFTGQKSFRKVKEGQLILFGENNARLDLDFFTNLRFQKLTIKWDPQKIIYLNQCKIESITDFIGTFSAIVFSPEDLNLVKGNPQRRRNFLDIALSQINKTYPKLLIKYNKILSQRNALLKEIYKYPGLIDTLDVWDSAFAKISATITKYRIKYISALIPIAQDIYCGISDYKEKLDIKYILGFEMDLNPDVGYQELYEKFEKKIFDVRNLDIKFGFSQVGPHKDDFNILLDNLLAKSFASQGQQRSIVLAIKLAEAQIIRDLMKKNPVILLDDVMSELDVKRKKYILNFLKDMQCFITCCDETYFKDLTKEVCLYKIDDLIKK